MSMASSRCSDSIPPQRPAGRFEVVDGIAHYLSATAGEHLRRLCEVYEPAWCTGWEEKANEYLPLALGLPGPFPHLSFADATPTVAGHWKLAGDRRVRGTAAAGGVDRRRPRRAVRGLGGVATRADSAAHDRALDRAHRPAGRAAAGVGRAMRHQPRGGRVEFGGMATPRDVDLDARENERVRVARLREGGKLPMARRLDEGIRLSKFAAEFAEAGRRARERARR